MDDLDVGGLLRREPDAPDRSATERADRIVRRAEVETGARDVGVLLGARGWWGIFLIALGLLELFTGRRPGPDEAGSEPHARTRR